MDEWNEVRKEAGVIRYMHLQKHGEKAPFFRAGRMSIRKAMALLKEIRDEIDKPRNKISI